jgi:hypothetical protein
MQLSKNNCGYWISKIVESAFPSPPYGQVDVHRSVLLVCTSRLSGFELSNPLWHTINWIVHILRNRFLLQCTYLIHHPFSMPIIIHSVKISTYNVYVTSVHSMSNKILEQASWFWNLGAVGPLWSRSRSCGVGSARSPEHVKMKAQERQPVVT